MQSHPEILKHTTMKTHDAFDHYTITEISRFMQWEEECPTIHFQLELKNTENGESMILPYSGGIAAFLSPEARKTLTCWDIRRPVKVVDLLRGVRFKGPRGPEVMKTLECIAAASHVDPLGVFYSLVMDADCEECSFQEWAENLGYNPDSIKDRAVYDACVKQTRKFRKLVGADFQRIADAVADY